VIAVLGWGLWMGYRAGLAETEAGLISTAIRRRHVAWEDIESLGVPAHQPFLWRTVYARCRSGTRVPLAVMQARRIVWNGGETRDAVAVLTERVNEIRGARGLEPLTEPERDPASWLGQRNPAPPRLPTEATISRLRRERSESAARDQTGD
jgi:hypothetical protein